MVLDGRRRKHGVSPGAVQVSYDAALRPLGLVLVGLSVVELVVFELVVPWQPVRLALLVLGVWTLLFVLGLVAANIVRPHVITDDELLLRFGTFAQAQIPLHGIATANARRRNASDSKALVLGDALIIGVSGTTNIDVDLSGPTVIRTSRGLVCVRTVRFAADDPAAAVRALRERVAAGRH